MPDTAEILCPICSEPALAKSKTAAARREVAISGICGTCWDDMHGAETEDEDALSGDAD